MATLTLTQAAGGHNADSTIETSDGAAATLVALGYAQHSETAEKPKRGRPAKATKVDDDPKADDSEG